MENKTGIRLLLVAGALMLASGCIFLFAEMWLHASLVWAGAFCCFVVTVNFLRDDL